MCRGVASGDSSDDDEQFDCELLSNCCWKNCSVLHAITWETSFDDGMAEACDVIDAYEYSKGFVIAMSELRISGVRGVFEPKSTPTPSIGGVWSDVLKLYMMRYRLFTRWFISQWVYWSSMQPWRVLLLFVLNKWLFTSFFLAVLRLGRAKRRRKNKNMQRKQMSH